MSHFICVVHEFTHRSLLKGLKQRGPASSPTSHEDKNI